MCMSFSWAEAWELFRIESFERSSYHLNWKHHQCRLLGLNAADPHIQLESTEMPWGNPSRDGVLRKPFPRWCPEETLPKMMPWGNPSQDVLRKPFPRWCPPFPRWCPEETLPKMMSWGNPSQLPAGVPDGHVVTEVLPHLCHVLQMPLSVSDISRANPLSVPSNKSVYPFSWPHVDVDFQESGIVLWTEAAS